MKLKSRNEFPPYGWVFRQPQFGEGWEKSYDPWRGFDECVQQIISSRHANSRFNLATDVPSVAAELELFTVQRLLAMTGGREFLLDDGNAGPPPVFTLRQPLRARLADAAGSARKIAVGMSVLKDWLGDGLVPVEREEAEQRASICVHCPMNQPGSPLVEAAAETFRRLVAAKNDMKLVTSHDEKLETCAACSCRLTLKVWAQLKHIMKHTDDGVRQKLWSECWILKPVILSDKSSG